MIVNALAADSDTSLLSSPDSSIFTQMSASDHSGVHFKNRHKDFFFDDGNVLFLVDDMYFRVHRYFFQRDSEFFRNALNRDDSPAMLRTGGGLITLTDITILDFERFLGILYPRDFGKPTATTVDEWASILDLSTRWGFRSVQSLAIEHLSLIASPIDNIVLGRKYNVTKWLMDAYRAVCEREQSLTVEEGERLGMQEVINISHARQAVRANVKLVAQSRLRSIIEETFLLGVIDEKPHAPLTELPKNEPKTEDTSGPLDYSIWHPLDVAPKEPLTPLTELTQREFNENNNQESNEGRTEDISGTLAEPIVHPIAHAGPGGKKKSKKVKNNSLPVAQSWRFPSVVKGSTS